MRLGQDPSTMTCLAMVINIHQELLGHQVFQKQEVHMIITMTLMTLGIKRPLEEVAELGGRRNIAK